MTPLILIPARMAATRLPGKPLADIAGQPMIVRCAQQAARSGARQVWVATDSPQVLEAVQASGFNALLTDAEHPTGTDRLAQAARLLELSEDEIVVNVQGDEPLIQPEHINAAAELLARSEQADIATLAAPIRNADWTANSPTGPQPQTATVSPGSTSQFSAAIQPVGRISLRNSTFSSSMLSSGMTSGPTSGTPSRGRTTPCSPAAGR